MLLKSSPPGLASLKCEVVGQVWLPASGLKFARGFVLNVVSLVGPGSDLVERVNQNVYLILGVINSETDTDHAWDAASVATMNICPELFSLGRVQTKKLSYIWVGAKTAGAHADTPLGAQDGSDQAMVDISQVESYNP